MADLEHRNFFQRSADENYNNRFRQRNKNAERNLKDQPHFTGEETEARKRPSKLSKATWGSRRTS